MMSSDPELGRESDDDSNLLSPWSSLVLARRHTIDSGRGRSSSITDIVLHIGKSNTPILHFPWAKNIWGPTGPSL
jgi:hypothetical protein